MADEPILEKSIAALTELKDRLAGSNIEVVRIKEVSSDAAPDVAFGPDIRFTVEAVIRRSTAAAGSRPDQIPRPE